MDAEKLIISTFKPRMCYTGSNTMYESSSENSSRACATAEQGDPVFVISFVEVPASTETSVVR